MDAWATAEVSATQAQSLQAVAWQAVSSHYSSFTPPDLAQCRVVMRDSVCAAYYNFASRPDQIASCAPSTMQSNPFYFNAATDSTYWFPTP